MDPPLNRPSPHRGPMTSNDTGDFTKCVRIMCKIIKMTHHLHNVSQDSEPPMICRMIRTLSTFIKPALPLTKTMDFILGNAKNWGHTSMLILQNHYMEQIDNLILELTAISSSDWQEPFRVAANRARRDLGHRLLSDSVRKAETILENKVYNNNHNEEGEDGMLTLLDEEIRRVVATQTEASVAPTSILPPHVSPSHTRTVVLAEVHHPVTHSPPVPSMIRQEGPPPQPLMVTVQNGVLPAVEMTSLPEGEPREQRRSSQLRKVTYLTRSHSICSIHQEGVHLTSEGNVCLSSTPQLTNPVVAIPEEQSWDSHPLLPSFSVPRDSSLDLNEEEPSSGLEGSNNMMMQPQMRPVKRNTAQQTGQLDLDMSPTDGALSDAAMAEILQPLSPTTRPFKHISTDRKLKHWLLQIKQTRLIIGDSNVSKFPPTSIPDLQIDSFPGATFRHIHGILQKLDPQPEVQTVIFSVGINNRKQRPLTAIKETQRLYSLSQQIFPNAIILFPLLNFSRTLSYKEQEMLQELNKHLKQNILVYRNSPGQSSRRRKMPSTGLPTLQHVFCNIGRAGETEDPQEPAHPGGG